MNYLKNKTCYLAGPVEACESFGADWRTTIIPLLTGLGLKPLNPLDRPHWMKQMNNKIMPHLSRVEILQSPDPAVKKAQDLIRDICLRYTNISDFVICYLPTTKTYGTVEELSVAAAAGKPILTICPNNMPSTWMYSIIRQDETFKSIPDLVGYLTDLDAGKKKLDPIRWMFMDDNIKEEICFQMPLN